MKRRPAATGNLAVVVSLRLSRFNGEEKLIKKANKSDYKPERVSESRVKEIPRREFVFFNNFSVFFLVHSPPMPSVVCLWHVFNLLARCCCCCCSQTPEKWGWRKSRPQHGFKSVYAKWNMTFLHRNILPVIIVLLFPPLSREPRPRRRRSGGGRLEEINGFFTRHLQCVFYFAACTPAPPTTTTTFFPAFITDEGSPSSTCTCLAGVRERRMMDEC